MRSDSVTNQFTERSLRIKAVSPAKDAAIKTPFTLGVRRCGQTKNRSVPVRKYKARQQKCCQQYQYSSFHKFLRWNALTHVHMLRVCGQTTGVRFLGLVLNRVAPFRVHKQCAEELRRNAQGKIHRKCRRSFLLKPTSPVVKIARRLQRSEKRCWCAGSTNDFRCPC